jgi:hypothetical protein
VKRSTEAAVNEAELHLRIHLWTLIEDAQRVLAVLDGQMPVVELKGSKPIPPMEKPKGNRVKFKRRSFTEEEVDFLDDHGLKELTRSAGAARVAFTRTMTLRRYGR